MPTGIKIRSQTAYFGDPGFAMEAVKEAVSIDAGNINNYQCPLMKQVRQLPQFKEFVMEIGLVDYWNKFGWPDICRPLGDGDFECD